MRQPFAVAALALSLIACSAHAGRPPAAPGPAKSGAAANPATPPTPPAPSTPTGAGDGPLRPNLFEVKSGTLTVTYATSGIDGKPHFTWKDGDSTVSASDAQIRVQEIEIGTLVSITIRRTVDSGSTSFSLLVPVVNLDPRSPSAPVNLVGITTVHRFSPVPLMNRGQLQLGNAVMLSGTARQVKF